MFTVGPTDDAPVKLCKPVFSSSVCLQVEVAFLGESGYLQERR